AGGTVSRTRTVKLEEPTLVAASAARQETIVVPIGNPDPLDGEHDTDVTPTASVAAGSGNVAAAPAALVASTISSAGFATIGAVTSLTMTLKPAVVMLPAASDAVHVTRVVPIANAEPLAGEQLSAVTPMLSAAVTV